MVPLTGVSLRDAVIPVFSYGTKGHWPFSDSGTATILARAPPRPSFRSFKNPPTNPETAKKVGTLRRSPEEWRKKVKVPLAGQRLAKVIMPLARQMLAKVR